MSSLRSHARSWLLAAGLLCGTWLAAQPRLIFDTDFGGDADDLGALVMLHHFIDRGECELLAVMCWSTEAYAVPAIDAVNHYYGRPNLPIGARQGATYHEAWNYSRSIAETLPHDLGRGQAPDATVLYRRLLAGSPDQSVTIVTVGPLKNIELLLRSGPDSLSPLSGTALIRRKVREFVIMGGHFPEGENEWNFDGGMPGVTAYVLDNLPTPVTFTGFEVGNALRAGRAFNALDPQTPLYLGFHHFSNHAPWMTPAPDGRITDNACFDQTAVLYAVRGGLGEYWEQSPPGACLPGATGGNRWTNAPDGRHTYLRLTAP
ncbi:MAG: nucleoside hydrolase, partial [Lewinella sp.]|nr:nucleoside hydrolase [Lewinella sp.]